MRCFRLGPADKILIWLFPYTAATSQYAVISHDEGVRGPITQNINGCVGSMRSLNNATKFPFKLPKTFEVCELHELVLLSGLLAQLSHLYTQYFETHGQQLHSHSAAVVDFIPC